MYYLIKILPAIWVFAFIYGKNITLLDYGLEPSTINCTRGYASINHTIVLKSLVNYSKDESITHVQFRIQNVTDGSSTHFTDFDIASKCVPIGSSTDCKTVGQDAVQITEKFNASKEYSGAYIIAILFGKDRTDSVPSKTIKLPEITETSSKCRFTTDSVEPMNTSGYTYFLWFLLIIPLAVIVLLVSFEVRRKKKHRILLISKEKVPMKASTGRPTEDLTEIITQGSPNSVRKEELIGGTVLGRRSKHTYIFINGVTTFPQIVSATLRQRTFVETAELIQEG